MEDKLTVPARRADALVKWYRHHSRLLPWRERPTPYRVWVSEIMLQQTRVEAVLPYFDRFIRALPDVAALAAVQEDALMKLWEGLGYYSRARNLKKAALLIMERHGGRLPASYELLLELPGIGEYTAGAVASIAFGIPVPAVDGNVLRVLARLLDCHDDITRPLVKKTLTAKAAEMVPDDFPGMFNQAVMELGQTVCLPNTVPHCEECPLHGGCEGYAAGTAAGLPVRSPKKARRIERRTVLVLISQTADGRRVLLHRREEKGLLAGLWELPNVQGWLTADEAKAYACALGAVSQKTFVLEEGCHIFSHIEWQMKGFMLPADCFAPAQDWAWVSAGQLEEETALPSAFRTYARLLPGLLAENGETEE